MCASCKCFVLLGRGHYDGPFPSLEESYRLCVCVCVCVCVCEREREKERKICNGI